MRDSCMRTLVETNTITPKVNGSLKIEKKSHGILKLARAKMWLTFHWNVPDVVDEA